MILSQVWILDRYSWPSPVEMGLDRSQSDAIRAALTRKVAVIQGPPGTGKTYIGLKIVQVLLRNSRYWRPVSTAAEAAKVPQPSPILIICYTNHALDQFLVGIARFTRKIVRIGGQSKCEELDPFNLREWKKRARNARTRAPHISSWLYKTRDRLNEQLRTISDHRHVMKVVISQGIVHERTLQAAKIINSNMLAKLKAAVPHVSGSLIHHWLGVERPELLTRLLSTFTEEHKRRRPPPAEAEPQHADNTQPETELGEEDQWEKEDIDEILGQRLIDDEAPVVSARAAPAPIRKRPEANVEVEFGYLTSGISSSIQDITAQLEDAEVEVEIKWHLGSLKSAMEKSLAVITKLLEIAPDVGGTELSVLHSQDFYRASYEDRWRMYATWKKQLLELMAEKEAELVEEQRAISCELRDVEMLDTAQMLRAADIVGITTTGAAKQRALLEHLKCRIGDFFLLIVIKYN